MKSKPKAQSDPRTPLTIKWTGDSIEGEGHEEESGEWLKRLTALIAAFAIGFCIFGSISWFLGERLWVVHSILGGLLTCVGLRRWVEKRLGWRPEPREGETIDWTVAEIRKRRLAYSIPGIATGTASVWLTAWVVGGSNWILVIVMGALGGYQAATEFG